MASAVTSIGYMERHRFCHINIRTTLNVLSCERYEGVADSCHSPPSPAQSTCQSPFSPNFCLFCSPSPFYSFFLSQRKYHCYFVSYFASPHFLSQYYLLLKMFNFLLRKDERKILKRKDSDAGERGTLCILHSFLFTIFQFLDASGLSITCLRLDSVNMLHRIILSINFSLFTATLSLFRTLNFLHT